jgi:NADH:ubiquinone oxidoreductase subunit F (NADH-binding)
MEGDPHRIIEGMIIAGYVVGAVKGYIYINAEADISKKRVDDAITQAVENGLLGSQILGTDFSFDLEIRQGAGGYVCGEETTLLNTIEGDRRVPRLRPPFPTESGLWSSPTVINNIETLAFIPTIIADGGERFCQVGTNESPGTKLFSLSGAIQRTGLVEMPLGTSVGQLIYDTGGGALPDRSIVAAAVGGPSSGMLPSKLFDSQLVPPVVHSSGVVLGAGGVVAIDDQIPILEVIRNLAMYNAVESCGKCTPCREGTPRIVTIIDNLLNKRGKKADLSELKFLADLLPVSLCGLGQMAGNVVTNSLELFKSELDEGLETS